MAVSNPPHITTPMPIRTAMPITAPSKIFGSRPELLRCVSAGSFLLAGQTVELTGQSSRESGLVGIRTKWGALYDLPKEFLLRPGEPEPEPIKLRPDGHRVPNRERNTPEVRTSDSRTAEERPPASVPIDTESKATPLPEASPLPEPPAPSAPEAPQAEAIAPAIDTVAPKIEAKAPPVENLKALPAVEKLPPGVVVKKLESGEEVLVARDGTYRPATTDPYRGIRAIAAQQALGKQYGTRAELGCVSGMVRVTLVQPNRRDAESIRAEVLRRIVAAATDGEFLSVCQKQRATKAERNLADRIRALRNVGTSADDWDVRRRIGVTIQEIRSK